MGRWLSRGGGVRPAGANSAVSGGQNQKIYVIEPPIEKTQKHIKETTRVTGLQRSSK